jgi:hypothetical protein
MGVGSSVLSQPLDEAFVVPGLDSSSFRRAPTGGEGQLRDAQDLIARAQALIDSPRPPGGYPLEWHVEAPHVGDLPAIATIALRAADRRAA